MGLCVQPVNFPDYRYGMNHTPIETDGLAEPTHTHSSLGLNPL